MDRRSSPTPHNRLRQKTRAALCALAVGFLSGCAGYHAPTVSHTYVTNTQDYHQLSALRIKCQVVDGLLTAAAASVFGLREYQAFYVDGREVFRTNGIQSAETLVQLPPGDHELLVTEKVEGALTFNSAADAARYRIRFTLRPGTTATVTTQNWGVRAVDDADFEVLEGPQLLGATAVTPKNASSRRTATSPEEQLKSIRELHTRGLISDETYQNRMAEIVSSMK